MVTREGFGTTPAVQESMQGAPRNFPVTTTTHNNFISMMSDTKAGKSSIVKTGKFPIAINALATLEFLRRVRLCVRLLLKCSEFIRLISRFSFISGFLMTSRTGYLTPPIGEWSHPKHCCQHTTPPISAHPTERAIHYL